MSSGVLDTLDALRPWLLGLALLGFLFVNGPFVYFSVVDPLTYDLALQNGLALTFMGEALLLVVLLSWLIARLRLRPGWPIFVALSFVGSLAFSLPFYLYLLTRYRGRPPR